MKHYVLEVLWEVLTQQDRDYSGRRLPGRNGVASIFGSQAQVAQSRGVITKPTSQGCWAVGRSQDMALQAW